MRQRWSYSDAGRMALSLLFSVAYPISVQRVALTKIQLELSTSEVHSITGFLGYGNPSDSVWFMGIEEGLGDDLPPEK